MTSKLDTAGLVVEQLRAYAGNSPDDYRNRAADLIEALKRERDELLYLQSEVEAGDRIMTQRLEAAEARVAELETIVARVPDALSAAFSAGIEERDGGSARRQEKYLAPVEELRRDIAALAHKGEGRS